MVLFDWVLLVILEELITLVINVIKLLLAHTNACWVSHRLANGLLSHLLLSLFVSYVLLVSIYDDTPILLSVCWWIIITLLCCLSKVFCCLVHSVLVLLVLQFLLLLTGHKRSFDWRVFRPSHCCLTLRVYFSHLDHIIVFLNIRLLIIVLFVLVSWYWILFLISLIRADCRVLGLLWLVVNLIPLIWTSHCFMNLSSILHYSTCHYETILIRTLNNFTCCKEHWVDIV